MARSCLWREADDNIAKSVRNIQGVTFVPANGLNAYDVVNMISYSHTGCTPS